MPGPPLRLCWNPAARPRAESVARTTRQSLLLRLRDRGDQDAWSVFYELYAPLLLRYAAACGLGRSEAEEVRDHCLEIAARKLPGFRYEAGRGGFKAWLHRIARDRVVDLQRRARAGGAGTPLDDAPDPADGPPELWERNWRREHLRYALEQARAGASLRDFRAFEMLLLEDASVPEVCAALAMNPNQVYKARLRLLQRVRAVLERLEG